MTRVRVEDLPPKLRRQVLAADEAGGGEAAARPSKTRRTAPGPGTPYRCCSCGELFPRYGAAAERHADGHGGARLEAVLHDPPPDEG